MCIKLKELIERLFPRRSRQRRTEVEREREREKGERGWEQQQLGGLRSGVRGPAAAELCFVAMSTGLAVA